MRLALFSDVHGNPYACRALLEALDNDGHFDARLALGDLCLGGSDPGGTLDMLRQAGVLAVYGNTEEYIQNPYRTPPDEHHASQWDVLLPIILWTVDQLSEEQKAWLGALPFQCRISPNGNLREDLVAVHANPLNCETMLYPSMQEQRILWNEVRQPDEAPDLKEVMAGFDTETLAFGHFHTPGIRHWQDIKLINVASVSLPSIDHDLSVRYTVLTWDGPASRDDGGSDADDNAPGRRTWRIQRRRIPYDASQEVQALARCGMPGYTRFSCAFSE